MQCSNFIFYTGENGNPPFVEVPILTPNPLLWVSESREALTVLLESFQYDQLPNGKDIYAFGVRLLSFLYPLPDQFDAFVTASGLPLVTPPENQTGGFYLTTYGLKVRYSNYTSVDEILQFSRSLFTLSLFSAYDLDNTFRQRIFSILDAFTPNSYANSQMASLPLNNPEKALLPDIKKHTQTNKLFSNSLQHPDERLKSRLFKAIAFLYSSRLFEDQILQIMEILFADTDHDK